MINILKRAKGIINHYSDVKLTKNILSLGFDQLIACVLKYCVLNKEP